MYQILIVDDETITADSMAQYVDWEKLGFSVSGVAYDVKEALDILKKKKVDVILTDIIMGKETGLELLEQALILTPGIRGVIISGHENFKFAQNAIKLGVYDYLVKPVEFDELEDVFSKLAKRMDQELALQPGEIFDDSSEGIIIKKVKEYISEHYNENITLPLLADIAFVHPIYLSSLFKKQTGQNFKDYLMHLRVEKAKEFLQDVSMRVSDVSQQVGYDSPKHFSKVFKDITGMTPKDYRNHVVK